MFSLDNRTIDWIINRVILQSVDSKSTVKIERLIDSSVTFRDDVREIALATKKSQMVNILWNSNDICLAM